MKANKSTAVGMSERINIVVNPNAIASIIFRNTETINNIPNTFIIFSLLAKDFSVFGLELRIGSFLNEFPQFEQNSEELSFSSFPQDGQVFKLIIFLQFIIFLPLLLNVLLEVSFNILKKYANDSKNSS